MRSPEQVRQVLSLSAEGLTASEIARRTGVPRGTVRDWVAGAVPRAIRARRATESCPRCGAPAHNPGPQVEGAYAYLLGLYLGDGSLSAHPRGVFKLRVVLDDRYPGILSSAGAAMRALLPDNVTRVQKRHDGNCSEVQVYSKKLACLFPQHGRGPKHKRAIRLEPWQRAIVERHPRELLRGLIHSDGCRFTNVVRVRGRRYAYARYNFTNASADIRAIFCEACDLLGIEWRRMNARNVSVARRGSVALLDEFVGPKA